MQFQKMLIMMFFLFFFGLIWYILKHNDKRLAFFSLKLLATLMVIKLVFLFQYDDVCQMAKEFYCR